MSKKQNYIIGVLAALGALYFLRCAVFKFNPFGIVERKEIKKETVTYFDLDNDGNYDHFSKTSYKLINGKLEEFGHEEGKLEKIVDQNAK